MQPRPPAMTVHQLPNREKSPPTADPAAATVAASTAAAAATDPAAGRKKRKKRAEEDASAATTRRRVRPRAEPDAAVGTPTVGEPATPGRAYRGKCLYQSRKCENERALKRNGQPHNLCEEHRSKQNQHQRKFDAKKFSRRRRSDGEAEDNNEDDGVHAGSGSSPTNAPTVKTEPVEDQNQPPHQQQSVRLHPHAGIPPLPSLAPPAVTLPPRTMPQEYAGLVLAPPPPSANYRLTPPSSQPLLQHQFTLPHQQPSPMHQQSAFDGRPSMPRYSLSELEAARVLVPTTSAPPPSTTPSAFVDVRHEMQSNMQFSYQQQMPSTYRRQMSAPAPAPLRRLEDMRGTSPKPMLPSLLRPPPHSFPPSPHNSTFGMSALRSPLMSSSASPLSSVPRLSSLPASVAPPAPTIERLPPLHARRPPLGPATSQ